MKKKTNRLTKALLETANDMLEGGIISNSTHEKITMKHLGHKERLKIPPISSNEIRDLRARENLSQAVFANYLNLTVGYISQLERGLKEPTGATLVLLNVIRRKGVTAIL